MTSRAPALVLLSLPLLGCGPDAEPEPPAAELEDLGSAPCRTDGPDYVEFAEQAGLAWHAPRPAEEALGDLFDSVLGGGAAAVDLDDDTLPELLFTSPFAPDVLFAGDGAGGYLRVEDAGFEGEAEDWTYAVSAADLDGDRLPELLLLRRSAVRLYRNLGALRFEYAGDLVSLPDPRLVPMGAAWTDFDGDGHLDVYLALRSTRPEQAGDGTYHRAPDLLLRGLGDLRFEDASHLLGPTSERHGHAFGAAWFDANGDGELDVYAYNDHGAHIVPNKLFLRDGVVFREDGAAHGLDIGINAMGIAIGDVDGDGRDEVALSDTSGLHLLSPDGRRRYRSVTTAWGIEPRRPAGLASWAMELVDVEADGDLDLLVAWGWKELQHTEAATNDLWLWEDGAFEPSDALPPTGGPTWRSVLPADLDADGAPELVWTQLVGAPSLQRRGCPEGAWVQVRLDAPTLPGNRALLGAEVEVEADGRVRRGRIGVGSSGVHSALDPVVTFGLGDVEGLDRLTVTPPGGEPVTLTDLPVNARLRVVL